MGSKVQIHEVWPGRCGKLRVDNQTQNLTSIIHHPSAPVLICFNVSQISNNSGNSNKPHLFLTTSPDSLCPHSLTEQQNVRIENEIKTCRKWPLNLEGKEQMQLLVPGKLSRSERSISSFPPQVFVGKSQNLKVYKTCLTEELNWICLDGDKPKSNSISPV